MVKKEKKELTKEKVKDIIKEIRYGLTTKTKEEIDIEAEEQFKKRITENKALIKKRKNYRMSPPKGKNVKDIFSDNKQGFKRIHSDFIGLLFIIKQNKKIYHIKTFDENIKELKKMLQHHYNGYLEITEKLKKMFYDIMNSNNSF